jgi:hypothetical protein
MAFIHCGAAIQAYFVTRIEFLDMAAIGTLHVHYNFTLLHLLVFLSG